METSEHVYPVCSTTCSWNKFVEFFMRWFLRWSRIFPNHQPRFVFTGIAVRFVQNKLFHSKRLAACTFASSIKAHLMSRSAAILENGTSARTKYQFAIELLPWIISIIMFAFCCVISLDAPAPSASSSIFNLIVLARNVRVRKLFSEHEVHSSVMRCVVLVIERLPEAHRMPSPPLPSLQKPFRSLAAASNTCVGNHRSSNAFIQSAMSTENI